MAYGVQIYNFKYSTFLKRATYFESTGQLIIKLKTNKEYNYHDIDIMMWEYFCKSEKNASDLFRNELKKNLIVEVSEEEKEINRKNNLAYVSAIIKCLKLRKK